MALLLLDTTVCVDILRGRVTSTTTPAAADCCLSAIVTAELWTGLAKGVANPDRARKLEEFVGLFPVLDFDDAAARHYGEIRADLEKRGLAIGPLDLLIAAHARSLGASLVTGNVREFRRVKGLGVSPWTITKRGKVVAQLMPAADTDEKPWLVLRGTVLKYDKPFEPAVKESDIEALK